MAGKQEVTLTFAGDDKTLSKTFDQVGAKAKQLEQNVGRASTDMAQKTGKASKFMRGAFQVAAGSMIASFSERAMGAVTGFLSDMVSEARDAEKVSRSTAQGIKTIGAASWTSAEQVGALAEKISEQIGVDDELIQQSANLLLTFRNVRNEVGKNNDIFNRAVQAAQDLAAKGFGDADSAAKMLGKALNDPIKGITALSRAGVTFTQQQKDQIAAMVESGDILGAQKIIMQELESQVGGTAEAMATGGDKAAVAWGNFQEKLGTEVLPVLDTVLGHLNKFIEWAGQHPVIVGALGAITAGVWLLNAALAANPIVLVIAAVAALVAGLIILWEKSAGFRDFFIGVWHGIQNVVGSVVGWIRDRWQGFTNFIRNSPVGRLLSGIFAGPKAMIEAVAGAIGWLIERVKDAVNWLTNLAEIVQNTAGLASAGGGGGFSVPGIPGLGSHHTGGMVTGGIPGQEVVRKLQVGERVIPRGQAARDGGGRLEVVGDVDSVFATYLRKLVRDGTLRLT